MFYKLTNLMNLFKDVMIDLFNNNKNKTDKFGYVIAQT